jgi:hypothetical protein
MHTRLLRIVGRSIATMFLLTATGAVEHAGAQAPTAWRTGVDGGWTLRRSSGAELWYHVLASLGYDGVGPLPFHADGYVARLRATKATRGIAPGMLEERAVRLRQALRADPAFEVLHFVPLYFPAADAERLTAALRTIAEGRGATLRGDPRTAFGAAALDATLPRAAQRQLLAQLADVMDDEWRRFYRDEWQRRARADGERVERLQREWDTRFASALAPYLRAMQMDAGSIFVVPALGYEGRVFGGDPDDRTDNIIVVALPDAGAEMPDDAALLLAVRESCFPLVERVIATATAFSRMDRSLAAGESSRAAVRCGALLLDHVMPASAPAYRALFVRASRPGRDARTQDPTTAEALARAFPLQPTTERALWEELNRACMTVACNRAR